MRSHSWSALRALALAGALACGLMSLFSACKALNSDERDAVSLEGSWLSWRGPWQNGTSRETDLLETLVLDGENHLWSLPLAGRGTPVVAEGRVFALGYEGEGADLQELLVCVDESSGEVLWERRWNDHLSDSIYTRYAIGSPTIDPTTGDVFAMSTAGELMAFSADGEKRWRHSLMAEFGRLTFPNGRTGAPVVDGELVIVHGITSHWGPAGPARDRFYAFDKETGRHVWSSTPGVRPVDSSFSMPVLEWRGGRRVLYATTGCGNVVCLDARSGDPLWRFQLASGGLNSAPLVDGDRLIAINGKENFDNSTIGRMVALRLGAEPEPGGRGPLVVGAEAELWRNDLLAFTSSPVLVEDAIYQTTAEGFLCRVDAVSGVVQWKEKLAPDQIHASPAWADGKLYVPMNDGSFHIVRPEAEGVEVLCSVQLEGNCLGAPAIANGRVYVHTTARLYCFGSGEARAGEMPTPAEAPPIGVAARLQIVPADVLVQPGEHVDVEVHSLDAHGGTVERGLEDVAWREAHAWDQEALVDFDSLGFTVVHEAAGTRVVTASLGGVEGTMRVRVVPELPFTEDFEDIALATPHAVEEGVVFATPPSQWLGIRKKWEVRYLEGSKVLAKTLDVPLFQRSQGFIGHPRMSGYTMRVDIRTDGNRRTMSSAGVINQRYLIQLKGNYQALEVSSNMERIKESVPYKWKAGLWYTLETRVDVAPDGSGIVRARVWPRDDPAPEAWTIEVPHARAHTHGSPGLFGFAPQSRFRVYLDNISVTPNE